jgi:hypothetical protein
MAQQIDTAKVAGVRPLHFDNIDACLAEVDRIVAADQQGRLRTLGNWTAGQVLAHIAAWIEYGYHGYPLAPPPFFVRWILRWQVRKFLRGSMPRGVRIPRVQAGTYGMDPMPTAAAAERLKRAFGRLQAGEAAKFDSPAFGPMSHEDRIRLNLRHAELHLGFLDY